MVGTRVLMLEKEFTDKQGMEVAMIHVGLDLSWKCQYGDSCLV